MTGKTCPFKDGYCSDLCNFHNKAVPNNCLIYDFMSCHIDILKDILEELQKLRKNF